MCATDCCKQCCSNWRLWIRPISMTAYGLFALILVPVLIFNSVQAGFSGKDQLILIGGLFVLAAIPISVFHITQHITHFTKPVLQRKIIRILWMVPIYAVNAWLGLIFPEHSIYMDSIREIYEAYVIYNFMVYLLNYLNLSMDLERTLEDRPPVKHFFPLCCMSSWEMGREFVHNCKHGILQYTVVRPITAIISLICELCGVYGEGTLSANVAFPYILFVNNLSQFVAMYCLVLFYKATKIDLKPLKPLPKFLCIKAVIFFSFFQGVIITILVYFGYIKNVFGTTDTNDDDYKILSSKLQDFLICIEMFLAALAHKYSFPHDPFHINIPHYSNNSNWFTAFRAMWDITDVQEDVTEHFGVVGSSLSRRLRGRTTYHMPRGGTQTEVDYLIPNAAPTSMCYQSGITYPGNLQSATNAQINPMTHSTIGNDDLGNKKPTHYGAFDKHKQNQQQHNDGGIQIIKQQQSGNTGHQTTKEYIGGGAPKIGEFFHSSIINSSSTTTETPSSSSNRNDKSSSDNTTNTQSSSSSTKNDTYTCSALPGDDYYQLQTAAAAAAATSSTTNPMTTNIKKSDSTASDWLSTPPTDEIMGIDVRGIENDKINYKRDPKV